MEVFKILLFRLFKNIRKLSNSWKGQLLLMAIPVLIIFIFINLIGKAVIQGDVANFLYPTLDFIGKAVGNKTTIFWNFNTLSGFATFVTSGEFFSPLNLILLPFFSYAAVAQWLLVMALILSGFFTARFLKALGLSNLASVFGGLVFMVSVQTIDLPLVRAYMILPLFFWLLTLATRKNKWGLVILSGLVLGYGFLTVHYNWIMMILAGSLFLALGLAWIYQKSYIKVLWRWLVMVGLGLLIGLIRLLPLLALIPASSRGSGLPYVNAIEDSLVWGDLVSFLIPGFNFPYIVATPILYFGVAALILLITALTIKKRRVKFFALSFFLCLLISVKYSPLFWLMHQVPAFEYFKNPSRWMFLGLFAASILAAFGAEEFLSSGREKIKKTTLQVFKWLTIVMVAGSVLATAFFKIFGQRILAWLKLYFKDNMYQNTIGLPLDHYYKVIDDLYLQVKSVFDLGDIKYILYLALIIVSYLLLSRFYYHKINSKHFLPSLVLLAAVTFLVVLPANFSLIDKQVFNRHSKVADFIKSNPGRTLSFLPGFSEYEKLVVPYGYDRSNIYIFQSEFLTPKLNNFYNLASANGFDSMMPEKYAEIIGLIGSDRAVVGKNKLSEQDIPLPEKIILFWQRHNLLDMLGVKYVISTYDLESEYLTKVFEVEATQHKIPIYVYENARPVKITYITPKVKYLTPGAEENLEIIKDSNNNFNQTTFIECDDCPDIVGTEQEVSIVDHHNGYLKAKVNLKNKSWVVFAENNLPGWSAYVDGELADIYTANYVFGAILVPAGEHEVIWEYSYKQIIKSLF